MEPTLENIDLSSIKLNQVLEIDGKKELVVELFDKEPVGFETHSEGKDKTIDVRSYRIKNNELDKLYDNNISPNHKGYVSNITNLLRYLKMKPQIIIKDGRISK